MKTFLLLIILFSFLQSAFLQVNLVLVILIARSLVTEDSSNLFLGFIAGIVLSFLTQTNIGYFTLIFLVIIKLVYILKKLPVSFNVLTVFLIGGLMAIIAGFLNWLFLGQTMEFHIYFIEAVLVVISFYLIKFWEERFIPKSSIKLRV